jgi:hypothetical protein
VRRHLSVAVAGVGIMLGSVCSTVAATNSFSVGNSGFSSYLINGESNPNLSLVRGFTYIFQVNASGHPFWIKSVQGRGAGNAYNLGVSDNGTAVGTVQFVVPTNAPSQLFYNCQNHSPMTGELNIEDPPEIVITQFVAGTSLLLVSTGTEALNVGIEINTNLVAGGWMPLSVIGNSFSNGTNTTSISTPVEVSAFFRVIQGFL